MVDYCHVSGTNLFKLSGCSRILVNIILVGTGIRMKSSS
uniref:Uncharacterized protein n=1 Tax=Rhizophora mucronata TaxID=61149 RepID=A0A2P2J1B3_RHIMU